MEEFENANNYAPQEPAPQQEEPVPVPAEAAPGEQEPVPVPAEAAPAPAEPAPYRRAGSGRKESPYADSPYVTNPPPPKPPKVKKERKPRKGLTRALIAILLAVSLAAGSSAVTAWVVNQSWEQRSQAVISQLRQELDQMQVKVDAASQAAAAALPREGDDMTPAQLYAGNVDSVVAISVGSEGAQFSSAQSLPAGSGFIFNEAGYIITNSHVVEGASRILVTTNSGDEYEATLLGQDTTNDVAVLKIEADGLQAAALGSSQDLVIGDMVAAIGNPLGELNATQTVGYISGINREVNTGGLTTISMIQTDAAINPGNSGGPLFNMYGQVIGITTAKYSGTTGSGASIEGIGFAIPIDDVLPLVDDIINHGYVTGAYMGVTVQDVDAEAAERYGLPTGAYIVTVEEGGAAQRAGIQPKDIVIALDAHTIRNVTDLTRTLRGYKAGDTAQVTVLRGGRETILTIVFDERPQETTPAQTVPQQTPMPQMPDSIEDIFDFFGGFFG